MFLVVIPIMWKDREKRPILNRTRNTRRRFSSKWLWFLFVSYFFGRGMILQNISALFEFFFRFFANRYL